MLPGLPPCAQGYQDRHLPGDEPAPVGVHAMVPADRQGAALPELQAAMGRGVTRLAKCS